jgi:hypothetical protein
MKKRRYKIFMLTSAFFLCLVILAGCNDSKQDGMALVGRTNPPAMDVRSVRYSDQAIPEQVKKEVAGIDGIYDVVVVQNGKKILAAYKVNHLKRFKMKKIEKNVTNRLSKKFKGYEFIVSSDYKIFLEAVRLNKMLKKEDVPTEKAKKKFEDIVSLQKEMT